MIQPRPMRAGGMMAPGDKCFQYRARDRATAPTPGSRPNVMSSILSGHAQGDEKLPFKAEAVDYGEDDKQRQEPMPTFADCLRCMNHVVCSILS